MDSASGGDVSMMRWSSVYGETPDRRSEEERLTDLLVTEKFVAQRIRLKQHYGWTERDVVPMKSISGWSAFVRFQARAAMKPVVQLQDYERKKTGSCATIASDGHGYGSPIPLRPDRMDTTDEKSAASPHTMSRRRTRPFELTP
ncbi:hypothetical protein PENTCL1PPCAC_11944 [Pristionchus entomophagus]|uniref:Uncharacterized protein n=1 Tax=Pristionchus entomophagus TaxID=358040 RepID=A0AAV5TAT3_9BILA|nr:hypothetical protein PENTCL1PPCAC_11944 [Pristionchus entomophagus]